MVDTGLIDGHRQSTDVASPPVCFELSVSRKRALQQEGIDRRSEIAACEYERCERRRGA